MQLGGSYSGRTSLIPAFRVQTTCAFDGPLDCRERAATTSLNQRWLTCVCTLLLTPSRDIFVMKDLNREFAERMVSCA